MTFLLIEIIRVVIFTKLMFLCALNIWKRFHLALLTADQRRWGLFVFFSAIADFKVVWLTWQGL